MFPGKDSEQLAGKATVLPALLQCVCRDTYRKTEPQPNQACVLGCAGATITGGTMTVEGCGSESLQGDVRFAEVMGLMGAEVQWAPYSITITGAFLPPWSPHPSGPVLVCRRQSSVHTLMFLWGGV